MNKNKVIRYTLLASLLIHLLTAGGIWRLGARPSFLTQRPHTTEVELISPEDLLRQLEKQKAVGQIVDQNEKAVNDETPKDAKYLSRHNQTVEKETRALLNGKFQNAQSMAGAAAPPVAPGAKVKPEQATRENRQTETTPPQKQKQSTASHKDGAKMIPSLDLLKPKFNQYQPPAPNAQEGSGGGAQASATDDHVKAPTGLQTMLSTREFVYFSYYNRIKDKLRQYWEPKIKEKMERILRQGRTIATSSDKITKVVILLDKNGTLVRVQIVGASGLTDLDDAAVEAFRAAAPFPNPPKGIVEADGLIRIRWDFILEASATELIYCGVA